jgi:molybdopterin molybdotransferase
MGRAADKSVGVGDAVAVPTGGMVPAGAVAVAPFEICDRSGHQVEVGESVPAGKHVRPAGEDARAGDVLVSRGRRLLGPDLGALAAAGVSTIPVYPPVRVGVLSTGDELVPLGAELGPGQIHDSNLYTLSGAVRDAGGVPVDGGRVGDDPNALLESLGSLDVDAFVCSGGVSVGARDPVKLAFAGSGDVDLAEIAMQPGKPQAFGFWQGKPFFGLPGNPVSVFVSFEVLVRPALLQMMGRTDERLEVEAILDGPIGAIRDRVRMARVLLEHDGKRYVATPAGPHQSNLLANFAKCDGLAVVPIDSPLRAGDQCRVIVFR